MESDDLDFDVIIVGGRVAGSVLAAMLGRQGRRVLVLERASFPSDTLSTHFFRAPALRAFQQIGAYDEVQAAAPHLTVNFNVVDGTAFPEPVDRPDDLPYYLCVRRITLDDILVRAAGRTPGVEFRQGVRAESLVAEEGRTAGARWKEADGAAEARARAVVGADGLRSFVAKQVAQQAEHEEPVNRAMYYAYYRGVQAEAGPAAEFHYLGDTLVYCFPCDDNLALLAASVPIAAFGEFKRDPEGKLEQALTSMVALAPRLRHAEREGPVRGTGSIPGYLRVPYGHGWALVGDAGMIMDPWSGQGIDQASTHAVMLAQRMGEYLDCQTDWGTAMQAYHRDRNDFSRKTYQRTCQYGRDLRPMTREALQRRGLA